MTEILSSLSDELAQVVAGAGPVAVRVEARRRLSASGIVWSTDGTIVTAHHAVERDENISVGLPDGGTIPATLVGRDPTTDVALLRVAATDLAATTWSEADNARVGHLVLALGRPGGSVMATLGVVSALDETWRTPAGGQIDRYLQTDVVMYPGFSGGPLVDATGRVLGLNTSALLRGIALAVPSSTLRRVVESLLSHGRIRRGYLGIGAQPVRLPEALTQELSQETGLLVFSVAPDSPAEKGTLLLGDIIVALDGHPTRHLDDLLTRLNGDSVGAKLPVRIVRGGQGQELVVTLGERK